MTTLDRPLTARHEAGHVAGLVFSGRVPLSVTADWPEDASHGVTTLDLSAEGSNRDSASDFIVSILLGPMAHAQAGWPPEWPLDENSPDRDTRGLASLADFLGLDEAGWYALVKQAHETSRSADFKRLVSLIASALERVDELSGEEIRFLIGPDTCRTYGIEPATTEVGSAS
jgi:hypothetical protein